MSVANGERLATKQDLADMYQGILPYLGGMPEMLANKFSKGDLYSTDEKMIGQWVDGKPLYQKTITGLNIDGAWYGDKTFYKSAPPLISDVDTIVTAKAIGSDSNNNESFITLSIRNEGNNWVYNRFIGDTIIAITLNYTKTTDSAISIGSDTDYSTEEKIVGTWITGEPIYQKYYPSRLTLSLDVWVDTGISKGSISKIISVEAYADNGTAVNSVASSCDGTNIKICSSVGSTLYDVHGFTLRYIKTI